MTPLVIAVFLHFDYIVAVLAGESRPSFGALFTMIRHQQIISRYLIGYVTISNTWILHRKGGLLIKFI